MNKTSLSILFVCHGNTCRSPMAKVLADSVFSLIKREIIVDSAGITAQPSQKATLQGQKEMKTRGLDLTNHLSKNVRDITTVFDYVICMETSIKEAIIAQNITIGKEIISWNIADPYRWSNTEKAAEIYENTATQIAEELIKFIATTILSDK